MSQNAIYARKSVYREDSISVESQIEKCIFELKGEDYKEYIDNGFSGKDTDRPDFQRLMNDIRAGKIKKVVVYKLDRISRSVLDFAEMLQTFQKYNVDFISATEHFDTTSPIGKAMLNISMVFAQMERETIQQRVTDAYNSRSRRGFYMGGKPLYAMGLEPCVVDGVKTSKYKPIPEKAEIVKLIYELYSNPSASLRNVLDELSRRGLNPDCDGKKFCTSDLSSLMRNPSYTAADINIYNFFKKHKADIINPPEDFDGTKSMYLFSGEAEDRTTTSYEGKYLVIAPHAPIVDSETWLVCRNKLLQNKNLKSTKAKNSFLAGKIKCGCCGYGLGVRQAGANKIKYLVCVGKSQYHQCDAKLPTMHNDEVEAVVIEQIKIKLNSLTIKNRQKTISKIQESINKLELEIAKIDSEMENLINSFTGANAITMDFVNKKMVEYDNRKKELVSQIEDLQAEQEKDNSKKIQELTNVMDKWDLLSFEDKRAVINLVIYKIVVTPDEMRIEWKI